MKSDIQGVLLRSLETITDGGYSVGVGFQGVEPHFVKSTYSEAWVERYISQRFIQIDPTIQFGLSKTGHFTWAELEAQFPDSKTFFTEARKYGLVKGNTLSIRVEGQVSILSGSGPAWQDQELKIASATLHALAVLAANPNSQNTVLLPDRVKDVLYLMADGVKDKAIADILGIKVETVRARRRSAFQATETVTIAQLMSKVIKNGLI
ncbi:helix-turn-helix transcriptional regulator [Parasedimentitalea huanghaiensis]|uniref:LuxR family transcriptional regulator n=1 Tax=Parasedimentitalea huanghaiensis TaxID=2682100 RepID=A0A6L6WMF6_9RHOB|nr:autoinducer binding domain-containing protein [Zongyanglinia huanghaiensis]MVO16822.1 LuxR family transcriptional regulator [Zongyanglinia huanghaiensis]